MSQEKSEGEEWQRIEQQGHGKALHRIELLHMATAQLCEEKLCKGVALRRTVLRRNSDAEFGKGTEKHRKVWQWHSNGVAPTCMAKAWISRAKK